MSAIKIDNRILCMGWYTYEEGYRANPPAYASDTVGISGHDRAAVVVCKGREDLWDFDKTFCISEGIHNFKALDKTFRGVEKNYLDNAEIVPI